MERVAIVGTGVAGLACAWALRGKAEITLLEKDARPGGHTNTVTVDELGTPRPIDTGFIVFNKVTYPNLCRLFQELQVRIKPSEMSFSVQHLPDGLEYNGMGPNKVFAQRRNFFRPRFHRFLGQVQRFFQVARDLLATTEVEPLTLGEFTEKHRLGADFLNYYLIPMSSAVWSTEPGDILNFPAATLIRFFHNHGFLGVDTHHQWFTVDGGSRTYLEKIVTTIGAPRLGTGAARVEESPTTATVVTEGGDRLTFDRVILACHGDQALATLTAPSPLQQRLLGPFRYQRNHATLHTDASVMPKKRLAWASWNYRVEAHRATTHYWMNALQGVSPTTDYFVSLNCAGEFPPDRVLYETVYEHPVFTLDTTRAQTELPSLNAQGPSQRIFFCGSYFQYGFHEDACTAGLQAAEAVAHAMAGR
jgi:uncharacterized protein